uniref:C-C motif chemokine n=1 Tax=Lepisosteus oculatus TaxID=7918 RepID=W5MAW2_LEPOC
MSLKVITLLLLASILWSSSEANTEGAVDCCLATSEKVIPRKAVVSYSRQEADGDCIISAVLFITKNGYRLCAPPNAKWVKALIRKLNKKAQAKKLKNEKKRGQVAAR